MSKEFRVFGPPGCLSADTIVNIRRGKRNFGRPITIQLAYYKFNRLDIPQWLGPNYPWRGNYPALIMSSQNGILMYHEIDQIVDSGFKELFELTTVSGRSICVTDEHPFKTESGVFIQLKDLKPNDIILCKSNEYSKKGRQPNKKRKIVCSVRYHPNAWKHMILGKNYKRISYALAVYEAHLNKMTPEWFIATVRHQKEKAKQLKYLPKNVVVHHKDENPLNDDLNNLEVITKNKHDIHHGEYNVRNFGYFKPVKDKVLSIECVGFGQTYDIVMKPPFHNYVAQEFIVHNTGKTSRLATRDIPRAVEKYGADKVMVTSYTRAAAKEISFKKSRSTGQRISVNQDNVGTMHSIMYHALNQPEITETANYINEWNKKYPKFKITGTKSVMMDEVYASEVSKNMDGDRLLSLTNIKRNKMISPILWTSNELSFYTKWTQFKKDTNSMDFTDMIEIGLNEFDSAPNHPKVIFVDEAQDFTLLQLTAIRKWSKNTEWVVLVGDDDQCQPENAMILTTCGYKKISQLDSRTDRLPAYSRQDSCVFRLKDGYPFKIAKRKYTGKIFRIHCDNKLTDTTPNHKWLVKWNSKARSVIWCVYLMRKGEWFRIGCCKLFRNDGTFHLGTRARLEKADEAWILETYGNKRSAHLREAILSSLYGIPTTIFNSTQKNSLIDQKFVESLYNSIPTYIKGRSILNDFSLYIDYPIWSPLQAMQQRGGKKIFITQTCNLIPGLMKIPSHVSGKEVLWKDINHKETVQIKNEYVYSLDVEKYHTYIADGLVTKNSLYSFIGATPDAMLNPPIPEEFTTVLGQSYRVPQQVLNRAIELITKIENRKSKEYFARKEDDGSTAIGEVRDLINVTYKKANQLIEEAMYYVDSGKSVAFLATCSYMLEDIKKELKERALPYHNPYRRRRRDWNPLFQHSTLNDFLDRGPDENFWTIPQFVAWAKFLKVGSEGLVRKVGRKGVKRLEEAILEGEAGLHSCREVLSLLLEPQAINAALARDTQWLLKNVTTSKSESLAYPVRVYEEHGRDGVENEPLLNIGTVHCSPPDEKVLTVTHGYVRMDALDPKIHKVFSYNKNVACIVSGSTNQGKGYEIKVGSRNYSGDLITMKTEKSLTRVTPDHRIIAKFNKQFYNKHVVYLMKRGDWWRIGICVSARNPYRSAGIGSRLGTEQADCGWILKVCDTRKEALIEEYRIQAIYGITGLTFEKTSKERTITSEEIHSIHEDIKEIANKRIDNIFKDFGLLKEFPLYTRSPQNEDIRKRTMLKSHIHTAAANLIDGYMDIPVVTKDLMKRKSFGLNKEWNKPEFLPVKILKEHYSGKVYSLNVNPHKHYISGGAIVHNSVKGATFDVVFLFPDVSFLADDEMRTIRGRESMYRVFYVGMTRAKHSLILCHPNIRLNPKNPRMYVPL